MNTYKSHPFYKAMSSDEVINETLKFYRSNFLVLFLTSLIATAIIQAILYFTGLYSLLLNYALTKPAFTAVMFYELLVFFGVSLVIYSLTHLLIVYYVIHYDDVKEKSIIDVFLEATRKYYLNYIVLSLLSVIILSAGTFAGIFIFIIGMLFSLLYFASVLVPATPAMIIEDKNPFAAIARSFQLSHKNFWGVLGALCLFIVLSLVIYIVSILLTFIPYVFIFIIELIKGNEFWDVWRNKEVYVNHNIISMFTSLTFSSLTMPLTPVFSVAVYYKLKYNEDKLDEYTPKVPIEKIIDDNLKIDS